MVKQSIGIAVLTLNAASYLLKCLEPLLASPLQPHILVVDSSSNDNTIKVAKEMGVETIVIPRNEFNHGLTREMARKHLNSDIVVMITPDAIAIDNRALEKLVKPIITGQAAITYGRQIPHFGADFFESFAREFNYPEVSQIRSLSDAHQYGVYTFFCSDSFAAYSNKALDSIGGFPEVLLGEDTVATALLLRQGYQIAYVAEAVVRHSHGYSLKQEFRRYFDTGLARADYGHLFVCGESDNKRGSQFVKEMFKRLIKEQPHLLPYACLQTAMKWFGYRLGKVSTEAPVWFKKPLSAHPGYWTSIHRKKFR